MVFLVLLLLETLLVLQLLAAPVVEAKGQQARQGPGHGPHSAVRGEAPTLRAAKGSNVGER